MTSLQEKRPSLLQKSRSDAGRRTQRRSFDNATTSYGASSIEHQLQLRVEEKSLLWDEEVEASPLDLLQNRKAKPGANHKQQRFTPDFARPKPALDRRHSTSNIEDNSRRISSEISFCDRMEAIGLHIVEIEPDGNCLFRAVAHQFYLDPERHAELRASCVRHMDANRDRFAVFCTTNFDHHLRRMAIDGTWAAELEVRALEEIFDRVFSIYSSDSKEAKPMPMKTNFDERQLLGISVETVKLSYHGNHYNSIFDVKHALPLEIRSTKTLAKARADLYYGIRS